MPLYESTFIARQDLSRQDVTRLTDQFTAIIEAGGGKVVKNEYWGLRGLAYRVKKNRKGHYTMLGLDTPVDALREMQRNIGINEEIIRSVTVRVDAIDENPSVVMSARAGREDEESSERPERASSAESSPERSSSERGTPTAEQA